MQRPATETEVARGIEMMAMLQREQNMSIDQARKYFCLMALNLNEFIYLD
jgi:hypothetical protein